MLTNNNQFMRSENTFEYRNQTDQNKPIKIFKNIGAFPCEAHVRITRKKSSKKSLVFIVGESKRKNFTDQLNLSSLIVFRGNGENKIFCQDTDKWSTNPESTYNGFVVVVFFLFRFE